MIFMIQFMMFSACSDWGNWTGRNASSQVIQKQDWFALMIQLGKVCGGVVGVVWLTPTTYIQVVEIAKLC